MIRAFHAQNAAAASAPFGETKRPRQREHDQHQQGRGQRARHAQRRLARAEQREGSGHQPGRERRLVQPHVRVSPVVGPRLGERLRDQQRRRPAALDRVARDQRVVALVPLREVEVRRRRHAQAQRGERQPGERPPDARRGAPRRPRRGRPERRDRPEQSQRIHRPKSSQAGKTRAARDAYARAANRDRRNPGDQAVWNPPVAGAALAVGARGARRALRARADELRDRRQEARVPGDQPQRARSRAGRRRRDSVRVAGDQPVSRQEVRQGRPAAAPRRTTRRARCSGASGR